MHRAGRVRDRPRRRSPRASSSTRSPVAPSPLGLGERPGPAGEQHVRRAEQPGAVPSLRKEAPLHLRAEENGATAGAPPARSRPGGVERSPARLAFGRGSSPASAASAFRTRVCVVAVERPQLGQAHAALGERAGLVEADRVDPGQALDRGQFLDQALRGRAGPRRPRRRPRSAAPAPRAPSARCRRPSRVSAGPSRSSADDSWLMISRAGRDHQPGDELEDRVDAAAQLGVDQGEPAGLLGELRGVRLAADLGAR